VRPAATSAALAVVLGVPLLGGCGGPSPGATAGQQVSSWARTTGLASSLTTLRADADRLARVEAGHGLAAIHTACDVLVDDALSANQNLPAPDGVLTGILTDAYRAAVAAGRDCTRAAAATGSALLARSTSELAAAASGYVKAQARLDDLGATD
jgi:hypothetical protein